MGTPSFSDRKVFWTVVARRKLRQALAEFVANEGIEQLEAKMNEISDRLKKVLPNAEIIVVLDQYTGFRARDDQFILLVEVDDPECGGRYVIKLGTEDQLQKEFRAWIHCRPHGLRNDLVFMTLTPHYSESRALDALIYEDAEQFLGVEETTTLEDAFLRSVLVGSPTPVSVANVISQLYERVGHLLYNASYVDDPKRENYELCLGDVSSSLAHWEAPTPARRVREDLQKHASQGRGEFRDPVDYFRFLAGCVVWPDLAGVEQGRQFPRQNQSRAGHSVSHWVPTLLRGSAHGDLHGRNVLVGVIRSSAVWPAVFDYEHMGVNNLLGWDFVKLETELKMRAFPNVPGGKALKEYIQNLQDFEITLAEQTEESRRRSTWPESLEDDTPRGRLLYLVQWIRRQAAFHLGQDRGRPRDWIDEYYFLLACYGVNVVRFQNLTDRERIGAFLSAGVATARFLWNREPEHL